MTFDLPPLGLEVTTSAKFQGDSYAEFPRKFWTHRRQQTRETLRMSLKTSQMDGLVMWQGQKAGEQSGKDFLAMYIQDGYLHFK